LVHEKLFVNALPIIEGNLGRYEPTEFCMNAIDDFFESELGEIGELSKCDLALPEKLFKKPDHFSGLIGRLEFRVNSTVIHHHCPLDVRIKKDLMDAFQNHLRLLICDVFLVKLGKMFYDDLPEVEGFRVLDPCDHESHEKFQIPLEAKYDLIEVILHE
jgi:hypothetical protein